MKRLVVGISGATGVIYGIRLLQVLRGVADVETHLVMSAPGKRTLVEETEYGVADVEALAHHRHDNRDIGASIASGSFRTAGMVDRALQREDGGRHRRLLLRQPHRRARRT